MQRSHAGPSAYTVADRAGNLIAVVIDLEPHGARDDERGGHEIAGRILSVAIGSEPPRAMSDNRVALQTSARLALLRMIAGVQGLTIEF